MYGNGMRAFAAEPLSNQNQVAAKYIAFRHRMHSRANVNENALLFAFSKSPAGNYVQYAFLRAKPSAAWAKIRAVRAGTGFYRQRSASASIPVLARA